jgi:hypothetical protein
LDLNTDEKTMSETEALRAFASTQQALWGKDPKRARGEQPDFVYEEEGIGVELARWAHERESQTERESKRLQDEIGEAVKRLNLTQFDLGREQILRWRVLVRRRALRFPRNTQRSRIIEDLLTFLAAEANRFEGRGQDNGWFVVTLDPDRLPVSVRPFIESITLWRTPPGVLNLGITLGSPDRPYVPEDALAPLESILRKKIVEKEDTYRAARRLENLRELWLVVYADEVLWNSQSYSGIADGLFDETKDRKEIVTRERALLSGIGAGPFDKVFLMFPWDPFYPSVFLLRPG